MGDIGEPLKRVHVAGDRPTDHRNADELVADEA